MEMRSFPMWAVFLPYCLERCVDGSYVVLNRRYKPLGVSAKERVVYETHPSRVRVRMTPARARSISFNGSDAVQVIALYDGTCLPTESAANWNAYASRLAKLAEWTVEVLE